MPSNWGCLGGGGSRVWGEDGGTVWLWGRPTGGSTGNRQDPVQTGAWRTERAMPRHLLGARASGGGWGEGSVPRNLAPPQWPELEGTSAPSLPSYSPT